MKIQTTFVGAVLLGWMLIFSIGCATARPNWDERVGHYTYDQAVSELGAPDNVDLLADGDTTAYWYSRQKPRSSLSIGTGISTGPVGVGVGAPVRSSATRVVRLDFWSGQSFEILEPLTTSGFAISVR